MNVERGMQFTILKSETIKKKHSLSSERREFQGKNELSSIVSNTTLISR